MERLFIIALAGLGVSFAYLAATTIWLWRYRSQVEKRFEILKHTLPVEVDKPRERELHKPVILDDEEEWRREQNEG